MGTAHARQDPMNSLEVIQKKLPATCQILAVSKLQPIDKIRTLFGQGARHFGENYAQEALDKQRQLADLSIDWHFIGHLQRKKVKDITAHFSLIHSVDSLELAQKISEKAVELKIQQKVLFQLNLANEESKGGFSEALFFENWPILQKLPGILSKGLMTMPPLFEAPELARPYFKKLRQIRDQIKMETPHFTELSMGTTSDYQIAADEGSTWIRLGTLLFGERPPR